MNTNLSQSVMAHPRLNVLSTFLNESTHCHSISFLDLHLQAETGFKTENHVDMTSGFACARDTTDQDLFFL